MDEISFDCPSCKQSLDAPADMAGEEIECPACGERIAIPEPEPGSGASPAPTCPSCAKPMGEGAVLCLACGYHTKLRKRIQTKFT